MYALPEPIPERAFSRDVADPVSISIENDVAKHLRRSGYLVSDVRRGNLRWDFEVRERNKLFRLDVKADRYQDTTGRVIFEDRHTYNNGRSAAGWGWEKDVDIVASVGVNTRRCIFVRLPEFRDLIMRHQHRSPHGWKRTENFNAEGDYITAAWAVPIDLLFRERVIWRLATVPNGGM